jgi:hypothetical protein
VPEDPDEESEVESGVGELLGRTWAWAKVLAVVAILAGAAVFAVVNWRTWFPTAAELGEATFTEVDRVAKSGERAAEQQRAVEELTGELPHLAPETIRLILSHSPTGVLEAREVFAIAGDATDRGFGTLSAEEAAELDALGMELHEGLGPLEREQLRDYGLTRARRLVFVEEHGYGLALVARGARTMPPERRARLQGLLAKAIAAGLGPPPSR